MKPGTTWTEVKIPTPHKDKSQTENGDLFFKSSKQYGTWPHPRSLEFAGCKHHHATWCRRLERHVVLDSPGYARSILLPFWHPHYKIQEQPPVAQEIRAGRMGTVPALASGRFLICSLLGPTLVFAACPHIVGNICFRWDPFSEARWSAEDFLSK